MMQLVKYAMSFCFAITVLLLNKGYSLTNHPYEKTEEQKAMKEVIQNFIDTMDLKYGLYCIGDGGRKREKIEEIDLTLETNRRASIEESREIHVNALELLSELINSEPRLKPFLATYPFPKESISVSINYGPDSSRFYSDGTITHTFNAKEKIFYSTHLYFEDKLHNAFDEPYQEALQIVKNHPLPYDMRYHKDQGFENELDALCYRFVRKVYKKYKIRCKDLGGKLTNGLDEVGFTFVSNKKTPIEEARKMQVDISQMLLHEINSNPKLKPFLKGSPFPTTKIRTKILFGKSDLTLFQGGILSRMHLEDGVIHYFKEKPLAEQSVWDDYGDSILAESFEEAANKLKNR